MTLTPNVTNYKLMEKIEIKIQFLGRDGNIHYRIFTIVEYPSLEQALLMAVRHAREKFGHLVEFDGKPFLYWIKQVGEETVRAIHGEMFPYANS